MPKPLTAEALEAIRATWAPVEHEPWCSSVIVMGHRPEPCDCGREPDRDPHRDIATLLAEVERLRAEVKGPQMKLRPKDLERECDTCGKTMRLRPPATQTTCSRCGDY